MKSIVIILAATFALGVGAMAKAQPVIELPTGDPSQEAEVPAREAATQVDPTRGLVDQRRAVASGTSVGGYGELHFNHVREDGSDPSGEIDLHRLVLFFAHTYDDRLSVYTEFEIEHAFVAPGAGGEVGIEQAFVDYSLIEDALTLRAGVVLMPMGITNQWHEPPSFNGVERPVVDKRVIPSTWREGGVGFVGQLGSAWRYELYLVSSLNPLGFSGGNGLRGGRQQIDHAAMNSPAVVGRLEVEPILGVTAGIAGYASNTGPNAGPLYAVDEDGAIVRHDLRVPVVGGSADIRGRYHGFEARAVAAAFSIGETEELREAVDASGTPVGPDIGSGILGAYAEVGYDLLYQRTERAMRLVPFARYEIHDTSATAVEGSLVGEQGVQDILVGASFLPHLSVVFKGDVIFRSEESGTDSVIYELGVGWMF